MMIVHPIIFGTYTGRYTQAIPETQTDKSTNYNLDYQFNKKWDSGAQITTGATLSMYVMIPPSWTRSIKAIT